MVAAIDDEQTMQLMRLFNEPEGRDCLAREGVDEQTLGKLDLLGISGLCNLVASIKTARYYEMDSRDVIFTPLTDSMDLYSSRLQEMEANHGPYDSHLADQHFGRYLQGVTTDHLRELNYPRPQGIAQLQVLYLGGTAGPQRRRTAATLGPGFLAAGVFTRSRG